MLYGNRLIHCSLFSLSLLFFSFSISSPFLQPFSHSPIYPYLPFCVPIFLLLVSRLPILYPAICPSGNHSKGSGHITLLFHYLAPSVRNIFFPFFLSVRVRTIDSKLPGLHSSSAIFFLRCRNGSLWYTTSFSLVCTKKKRNKIQKTHSKKKKNMCSITDSSTLLSFTAHYTDNTLYMRERDDSTHCSHTP